MEENKNDEGKIIRLNIHDDAGTKDTLNKPTKADIILLQKKIIAYLVSAKKISEQELNIYLNAKLTILAEVQKLKIKVMDEIIKQNQKEIDNVK